MTEKELSNHGKDFKVSLSIVHSDNVKVTLGEFTVPAFLGIFSSPNLIYMETLEGKGEFTLVLGKEPGEWNGQVEAKGNIPLPIVLEMEDLFVGLPTTFSKKNFSIFKDRSIDGNKSIGPEVFLKVVR